MKLGQLLNEQLININLKSNTKEDILEEMVTIFKKEGKIKSGREFYQSLLEREEEATTGMGRGVAIPHGKSDNVKELALALGISKQGVDFDSLDARPVHLFFVVADFKDHSENYLSLLAKISANVRQEKFRQGLLDADDEKEVLEIVREYD